MYLKHHDNCVDNDILLMATMGGNTIAILFTPTIHGIKYIFWDDHTTIKNSHGKQNYVNLKEVFWIFTKLLLLGTFSYIEHDMFLSIPWQFYF